MQNTGGLNVPAESLRDQWKKAKAEASKAFDLSKLVDKEDFGPKLDKYEAACADYRKLYKNSLNPPDAKVTAVKNAAKAAADKAGKAGAVYLQGVEFLEKNSTGATQKAAHALGTVLAVRILGQLRAVSDGNFSLV